MTTLEAIDRLIEAVEAGTLHKNKYGGMPLATACYPRDRDGRMLPDAGGWSDGDVIDAYLGSLDAAKALHEALLPGRVYGLNFDAHGEKYAFVGDGSVFETEEIYNECHARAWLLAILRAHRHQIAAGGE